MASEWPSVILSETMIYKHEITKTFLKLTKYQKSWDLELYLLCCRGKMAGR